MDQDTRAKQRRAILAGIAGNVMEWYDFTVYGYFAAVIGRQFFPAEDPISSLLAAFGVFAAGFLMRPFGSLVFGHIGDKIGRKAALMASVILMAVSTFLIGLLPTYQQIGITAPVLLVLLRLVQGLSVGGEYTTSAIFLVERSNPGHRGFLGSFGPFGACGGVLLGSAVGAVITTILDPSAVNGLGRAAPFHTRDQRGPFRALHPPSHAQWSSAAKERVRGEVAGARGAPYRVADDRGARRA